MHDLDQEIKNLADNSRLTYKKLMSSKYAHEFSSMSSRLGTKNARQIIYHVSNNIHYIPKCACGETLAWNSDERNYRKYCSKKCSAKYTVAQKKQDNIKKYGVEWHSQTDAWSEKVKQTSLEKYGAEHYSKTKEFVESVKKTSIEKYGTDHCMKNTDIKKKLENTVNSLYGSSCVLSNQNIREKIKNTNIKKYGVENPAQHDGIREKIKNTNIKKYGVENPAQNHGIRKNIISTRKSNHYTPETLNKINDAEYLSKLNIQGKTLGEIAQDLDTSPGNISCVFQRLNIPVLRHQHSSEENKIYNYFFSDFSITRNSRNLISPREIDLYFDDYRLGIEINGVYFHSEKFKSDPNYHLSKLELAQKNNITLLQFWDFEVNNSFDTVVNIIKSKLGVISTRIHARKTQVVNLNTRQKSDFLNKYHLQKNCGSSINLGLEYNNELVCVAAFSRNRFSKKHRYELIRLCTKHNIYVAGGASKLLSYFKRNFMNADDKLVSYADRRYSQGKIYDSCGFYLESISRPGFFYIDNQGRYAGSRYQWQKHHMQKKLSRFDPRLSAVENMKNNNYYHVWDCGQLVYVLKN